MRTRVDMNLKVLTLWGIMNKLRILGIATGFFFISGLLLYDESTHYMCMQVTDDPTSIDRYLYTMNGCKEGESTLDRRIKKINKVIRKFYE